MTNTEERDHAEEAETGRTEMKVRNPVVIHWVHEMDRALTFYKESIGLTSISESPGWSVLDMSPIQLALHILEPGQDEAPLANAGLNLEVDQIEDLVPSILALGGTLTDLREAEANFPVRVAMLKDPDGNAFELRQQV